MRPARGFESRPVLTADALALGRGRNTRRKVIAVFALLLAANLVIWAAAVLTFHHFALVLGTATLAYTLGLRHAFDADHISAIDNVTRKLVQDGRRPLLVGFYFSLGHSTVVILLSVGIAAAASRLQSHFPDLQRVGGLIGTCISAAFLLGIAGINLLVLRGVAGAFVRVKRGQPYREQEVGEALAQLGPMGRIFRPVLAMIDRQWKMYFLGFLFGLGFDTATEVGVLGISVAAATQGLPIWSILLLPALFTAGMCLADTADGILMLGAYGWACIHPVRKLYYNMTITAVSVAIALIVGGIELLTVIGAQFNLHGGFWQAVNTISDHFGLTGIAIIALFLATWAASMIGYRLLGYHELEAPAVAES